MNVSQQTYNRSSLSLVVSNTQAHSNTNVCLQNIAPLQETLGASYSVGNQSSSYATQILPLWADVELDVMDMIRTNISLGYFIARACVKAREYFGPTTLLKVETHYDNEEEWSVVYVVIRSDKSAKDAVRLLRSFTKEWFLPSRRISGFDVHLSLESL